MDQTPDPLYPTALRVVVKTQNASVHSLQRVLSIGFNRASRLIELMEAAGVVSLPDEKNAGKRIVLTTEVPA